MNVSLKILKSFNSDFNVLGKFNILYSKKINLCLTGNQMYGTVSWVSLGSSKQMTSCLYIMSTIYKAIKRKKA